MMGPLIAGINIQRLQVVIVGILTIHNIMPEQPAPADQTQADEIERLHLALQAAGMGTWDYNLLTQQMQWSAICKELFGLSADAPVTAAMLLEQVHPDDRQRVAQANAQMTSPLSNGDHFIRFRTLMPDQTVRWVEVKGKAVRNIQGQIVRFSGVVQDVTERALTRQKLEESEARYRTLSESLAQLVQEQTEELAASNAELAANNEELAAINEELTESTSLLVRSNENLQKFAYVASHDLQEPLRKIQSFGEILKTRFADQLGEGVDYLNRMQSAASRMSTLIRDLLTFSRISTQRDTSDLVSLTEVVGRVLTDLELVIQETGATIRVDPLPTVPGDASQLGQLFQNLLTNALKFHRQEAAPVIVVSARLVASDHLPAGVRPARASLIYHRIDVADNGMGFDEKYLDRIFQVFQRLHGKSDFAGTGIGLAISEKVVTNHGGAITATSQPGQGATFTVYLPV